MILALICSNVCHIRDEINPCKLQVIYCAEVAELEAHKQTALGNGEHLAIHLNGK